MAINVAQEVATHRHMSMSAENFMGTHHFDIFRDAFCHYGGRNKHWISTENSRKNRLVEKCCVPIKGHGSTNANSSFGRCESVKLGSCLGSLVVVLTSLELLNSLGCKLCQPCPDCFGVF